MSKFELLRITIQDSPIEGDPDRWIVDFHAVLLKPDGSADRRISSYKGLTADAVLQSLREASLKLVPELKETA